MPLLEGERPAEWTHSWFRGEGGGEVGAGVGSGVGWPRGRVLSCVCMRVAPSDRAESPVLLSAWMASPGRKPVWNQADLGWPFATQMTHRTQFPYIAVALHCTVSRTSGHLGPLMAV